MKKSMFTDINERYTEKASKDINAVTDLLYEAVNKLEAKGYKLRDISYALSNALNSIVTMKVLSK